MIRPANTLTAVYLCVEPVDFRNYALRPVMRSGRDAQRRKAWFRCCFGPVLRLKHCA